MALSMQQAQDPAQLLPPALMPTHSLVAFVAADVTREDGVTERQLMAQQATDETQLATVMKPIEEVLGMVWVEVTDVPLPGMYLSDVEDGCAAWRCGLQVHVGQRLTHINSNPVYCLHDVLSLVVTGMDYTHGTQTLAFRFALEPPLRHLVDRFNMHRPPPVVEVNAQRLNSPRRVLPDDVRVVKRSGEVLGCVLHALRVQFVNEGSPAAEHNLGRYEGMYLTHINGAPITDVSDMKAITDAHTVYLRFGANPPPGFLEGSPVRQIEGSPPQSHVPSVYSAGPATMAPGQSLPPADRSPSRAMYPHVSTSPARPPHSRGPTVGSATVVPHDPSQTGSLEQVTSFWL